MDSELFSNWFSNHFLKHAVPSRPLMLILDGHLSHYTLKLVKSAAENDVILFCLPPHTTADSQPLDTSCFGPLKTYWVETCWQFVFSNPGHAISKFQFSKLFSEAWSKGMSINNIISGFRCTHLILALFLRNCQKTLNRKLMMMKLVCPWSLVRIPFSPSL